MKEKNKKKAYGKKTEKKVRKGENVRSQRRAKARDRDQGYG